MRKQKAEQCSSCQGAAETECSWCGGTGVMMLGDTIFVNDKGTHPCPVCNASVSGVCEGCCEVLEVAFVAQSCTD